MTEPASTLHSEYVSNAKPYEGGVSTLAAGSLFRGPENAQGNATLPSDATTALGSSYSGMGYLSTDGIGDSPSVSSTDFSVWGGTVVLNATTGYGEEYTFTCVELSPEVHKAVWGDDKVSGTKAAGMTITHSRKGFDKIHVFVAVVVYADGSIGRQVIPKGKIKNVDTINYKDDELVGYKITLAALPGGFSDDKNATSREYVSAPGTVDAAAVGASGTSGSNG